MESELVHVPVRRQVLRGLGMLAGLLLLSGIVMALILFVANYFDKKDKGRERPLAVFIESAATPPRTYAPLARGQIDLPNHPGRPMAVSFRSGKGNSGGKSAEYHAGVTTAGAVVPVGLSVDAYRAATDSGKTVHLPNPEGECTLGGVSDARVNRALDNCFASRAAR